MEDGSLPPLGKWARERESESTPLPFKEKDLEVLHIT